MSEADDMQQIQAIARLRKQGLLDKAVDRVLRLLEEARKQILGEIAASDWDRFILPKLLRNVDAALETWRKKALAGLATEQTTGWTGGAEAVSTTLQTMGFEVSLPALPESLLRALEQRGATALTGLASFGRQQLDQLIATSLLSGASREDVIGQIGSVLQKSTVLGKPEGRFATLGARAAFIYRQEVGAAFAAAKHRREADAMQYVPDLQRVWRHAGHPRVPRPDHLAMHGQTRGRDAAFVNPVTGAELDYPRDPTAAIGETANCTCDVVLWRPLYGDQLEFIGRATTAADRAA